MANKPLRSKASGGLRARKRFGQNFLVDQGVIDRIAQLIHPQKSESIVEIGPGRGALTAALLTAGAELTAIELDRDLYAWLKARFTEANFTLLQGDALHFDFGTLYQAHRALRIVGNLPYNISTPLIFHLLETADHILDMHFMLQQEVVKRLSAPPQSSGRGRLSVMVQYFCEVTPFFIVSPNAFKPEPAIISQMVRLKPYQQMPHSKALSLSVLMETVRQGFSQRRKTLRNNLKAILTAEQLSQLGIALNRRPETLTIDEWVMIANFVARLKGSL